MDRRKKQMLENWKQYTLQTCKQKTAQTFQKMIRIEAADNYGRIRCVTCDEAIPYANGYKKMDAGHFVASRAASVLFIEENCHPQCVRCNRYLSGNQEAYADFMLERYGQDTIDMIIRARSEVRKFTKEELADMRISYMDRIKAKEKILKEAGVL